MGEVESGGIAMQGPQLLQQALLIGMFRNAAARGILPAQRLKAINEVQQILPKGSNLAKLFHGTTQKAAQQIKQSGFKPVKVADEIKKAYEVVGIPWEARKQIPNDIRQFIEMEGRHRIRGGEQGTVSFAPSYEVAQRWAGKGGEIAHEIAAQLRTYIQARKMGFNPQTTDEMFQQLGSAFKKPYTNVDPGAVLRAEVPLNPNQVRKLRQLQKTLIEDLQQSHNPQQELQAWKGTYQDYQYGGLEELLGPDIMKALTTLGTSTFKVK